MELVGVSRTLTTNKKVIYGKPYIQATMDEVKARNSKVLLVASKTLDGSTSLIKDLEKALGEHLLGKVSAIREHTPDDDVVSLAKKIKEVGANTVITFGGGSLIDAAKAVKIALTYNLQEGADFRLIHSAAGSTFCFLEPSFKTALTVINIPTTLSAGEHSGICGVKDTESGKKFGYVHEALAADVAVLDPNVTIYTPDWLFLSTGVRAMDHCIETLCSIDTNLFADTLALKGLFLLAENLPAASEAAEKLNKGPNISARLKCQLGTWFSMQGICQGIPMGASHGIGHVLGWHGVPHGHTSCLMLPHVMKCNFEKIPESKRKKITEAMGYASDKFKPHEAVYDFLRKLRVPQTLKDVGIQQDKLDEMTELSLMSNWVKSNLKHLTTEDIHQILLNVYDGNL